MVTEAQSTPAAPHQSSVSIPLTDLPAGNEALVTRMLEADHAMLIRLKTMGMHEGRRIRLVRQGSRVIVSCGPTRIGLSAEVARHVRVTPIAS
jgi:Fe2+ transport system protein FeoA